MEENKEVQPSSEMPEMPEPKSTEMPVSTPEMENKPSEPKKKGGLLKLIIALVVIGAIAAVVVLGTQGGWFQGNMFKRGAKLKTVAPIETVVTPKEVDTVMIEDVVERKVAVPVTKELEKEMVAKEVDKLVMDEISADPLPNIVDKLLYRISQPSIGDLTVGEVDVILLDVRLENDTGESLIVNEVSFFEFGRGIENYDITKFGVGLPSSVNIQNDVDVDGVLADRITLTLDTPLVIQTDEIISLELRGDVVGPAGESIFYDFDSEGMNLSFPLIVDAEFNAITRDIVGL